jgi:predicted nucleic acid-binding protein
VTNDAERKTLREYESVLTDYEISPEIWERAIRLADHGRASGITVPLVDILVFACAKVHGVDVAHDDAHFDELEKLEA